MYDLNDDSEKTIVANANQCARGTDKLVGVVSMSKCCPIWYQSFSCGPKELSIGLGHLSPSKEEGERESKLLYLRHFFCFWFGSNCHESDWNRKQSKRARERLVIKLSPSHWPWERKRGKNQLRKREICSIWPHNNKVAQRLRPRRQLRKRYISLRVCMGFSFCALRAQMI